MPVSFLKSGITMAFIHHQPWSGRWRGSGEGPGPFRVWNTYTRHPSPTYFSFPIIDPKVILGACIQLPTKQSTSRIFNLQLDQVEGDAGRPSCSCSVAAVWRQRQCQHRASAAAQPPGRTVMKTPQNRPALSYLHITPGIGAKKSSDVLGPCVAISEYSVNFLSGNC